MFFQEKCSIKTQGRKIKDITSRINKIVELSNYKIGLCHVFCQHTSCSLIMCENYDYDVKIDIETYMSGLVIDGDQRFRHVSEGKDDMSAHLRTLLTQSEITIPIRLGSLSLGRWQGLNLYEHRYDNYLRTLTITIFGDVKIS